MAWMHPPVHRLLGWATRPSLFGQQRLVWRLDQLEDLLELEALVRGEPAETDQQTLERLPTLLEATLLDRRREPIGAVADLVFEPATGRIDHYLVSRSDPRLPGSSRWRLALDRIVDQQPGRVFTAVDGLDDLPLARASVRQDLLRRSRRWRDQVQQAGVRLESRLEGWLEDPPWDGVEPPSEDWDDRPDSPQEREVWQGPEPWDDEAIWDPPQRQRPAQDDPDPWL